MGRIAIGIHAVAVVVLAVLWWTDGGLALVFLVPSALIGAASVRAVAGRPVTLYCGFGLLLGFGFWTLISAVRYGDPLIGVAALLLLAGSAWVLNDPGWPSLIFTGVVVALLLAVTLWMIPYGDEIGESVRVRRMARLTFGVLTVGMAYACAAFAEIALPAQKSSPQPARKKKRRPRVEQETSWEDDDV
jgi:hypothetical protein